MESRLKLDILPQPDDYSCGPTCLHAVYGYYGDEPALEQVVREVVPLEEGGTLAVWLACHALRRGYAATIQTYNLNVFDPTWFEGRTDLASKLRAQAEAKEDTKLHAASRAYLEFLSLGGRLLSEELSPTLLRRYLRRETPILTGLSATYLYGCAREVDDRYDDVRGTPMGHFVVLCGYDPGERQVLVADPLHDNPRFSSPYYTVGISRLVAAILLGIVTYDANLLIIEPSGRAHGRR